ncbi:class I SAM-dependent methyltransferase [Runella sp. SP2]|uniref:class I SAM-dependent methyltransferase n=1 Tax=Runella sp. SP2 TaxID=2268026 RepID=UPI000F092796|nr:class I SAM-dependent methyltransferase [Runella sp. SP2]AYQ30775.1 methyltransferase domain-containing protein [Runella sp. SP2]
MKKAIDIQKEYYKSTAKNYDTIHVSTELNEHNFALAFMSSLITLYDIKSILDVGAGTGRTIAFLQEQHPKLKIVGIEPVEALRSIGHKKGIKSEQLIDGDGNSLPFKNQEFDLVCEFGILHHVPKPEIVVAEMLRVSKKGIFISDCNNFGNGSLISRSIKQIINFLGLWNIYRYLITSGKMYEISEGDGLYYSYSIFNNLKQIRKVCPYIHLLNTTNSSTSNLYQSASHIALWGLKKLNAE